MLLLKATVVLCFAKLAQIMNTQLFWDPTFGVLHGSVLSSLIQKWVAMENWHSHHLQQRRVHVSEVIRFRFKYFRVIFSLYLSFYSSPLTPPPLLCTHPPGFPNAPCHGSVIYGARLGAAVLVQLYPEDTSGHGHVEPLLLLCLCLHLPVDLSLVSLHNIQQISQARQWIVVT